MKTYASSEFISPFPCVTALGCFDGVHVGHSQLIREARRIADDLNILCAVWSFSEPPKNFFKPHSVPVLTLPSEKRLAIQRLGVDITVSIPFDKNISSLSAEEFFKDVIIGKMKSKHVVCGFNYRFGKGGLGDTELLCKLCADSGIGISVIPPVTVEKITVSSSEVRAAIEGGKIELAEKLLGRPYSIRAKVISGKHLGHSLGFPTVNQEFTNDKVVPIYGVYLSRIRLGNHIKYGITNVGVQPTVSADKLYAETHIFDFDGNLYGKTVTVEFLSFLRAERKFGGVEALKSQISKDIEKAKNLINSKK